MNDETRHLMHEGVLLLISAVAGGFIGGTMGGCCKQYYFEKHTYFHNDTPPFIKDYEHFKREHPRHLNKKPGPFEGPKPEIR